MYSMTFPDSRGCLHCLARGHTPLTSASIITTLSLKRPLLLTLGPPGNAVQSARLKILNLITSGTPIFPCQFTYSQALGIRMQLSLLGGGVGIILSAAGSDIIRGLLPGNQPDFQFTVREMHGDCWHLGLTFGLFDCSPKFWSQSTRFYKEEHQLQMRHAWVLISTTQEL